MTKKTKSGRVHKAKAAKFAWAAQFDRLALERCSKRKDVLEMLSNNLIARSIPGGCSARSQIEQIAAAAPRPIAIESLPAELEGGGAPRGATYFGQAAALIDQIASQHENLRWWITDAGLNMAFVPPASYLSAFDECAGKLMAELWQGNKLSEEAFLRIAETLDLEKFDLKENLQKGWRTKVARHNEENPKAAIKTFAALARDPRFRRGLRKRLYISREKFIRQQ